MDIPAAEVYWERPLCFPRQPDDYKLCRIAEPGGKSDSIGHAAADNQRFSGVTAMHDVTEGGIYGALWEVAESTGVGLEIDLKKIPIRQETIEICEFFELNPYELISSGSLLMVTDDGLGLVRNLEKEGIPAAVIGRICEGNDRVVINDDEKRFLEPPKSDELYKAITYHKE